MDLSKLEPEIVWRHFSLLCSIPHASGDEAALRDALVAWAHRCKLETETDAAGNLLIRKPATPGYETQPGVILQAHMDMVCQKNADCGHDFQRDPIRTELRDGWLVAPDTTLGADNGMGVALALAALESNEVAHPPLEVLLTADEEAGMTGVKGLRAGWLRGTRLLNLDTEDWGEFYLGCAGGMDVEVSDVFTPISTPVGREAVRLSVRGLRGGHSGCDIHLQRGNAIKLLVRILIRWQREAEDVWHLACLQGGTARNALPREAWADIVLDGVAKPVLKRVLAQLEAEFRTELEGVDDGFEVVCEPLGAIPAQVVPAADAIRALNALHAAPHGVYRMSQRIHDVVETSNNLGVVRMTSGDFSANLMVRSLQDAGTVALVEQIESLFALAGMRVGVANGYPGWAPNPGSTLLAQCLKVYEAECGSAAVVKVIHAGLECGILGAKYPELDMVSLGPTIRGVHAPGERVEVDSVAKCWGLLKALLAAL